MVLRDQTQNKRKVGKEVNYMDEYDYDVLDYIEGCCIDDGE